MNKDSFIFSADSQYPYFTRTVFNNGILGYVDYLDDGHKIGGNCLAVGMMGMKFFYMSHDFYAGQFTKSIYPKFEGFDEKVAQWFISWFNKSSDRYLSVLVRDFEKVFNDTELFVPYKNGKICIPHIQATIEEFKRFETEKLNRFFDSNGYSDCSLTAEERKALVNLATGNVLMQRLKIVDVFNVANTHNILKSDVIFGSGIVPYVTASECDNSVTSYISYHDDLKESGNTIIIGGKTLVITYQPRDFFSNDSHNLTLTISDERGRTESAQLFMVAALNKSLKPIYSWGNSISKAKIQKDYVDFPISNDGNIDYAFMETYINALKKQCVARLKASDVITHNIVATTQKEEDMTDIIILDSSDVPESDRFTRFLPLYDVAIACGALVNEGVQALGNGIDMEGWIDASESIRNPNKQMFVVRAKGESMLPKIQPGDFCVFEIYGANGNAGSREGQIVLVRQSRKDNDYNCRYTIKQYHGVKDPATGRNVKVELRPLNPAYDVIEVDAEDGQVDVIATLKGIVR